MQLALTAAEFVRFVEGWTAGLAVDAGTTGLVRRFLDTVTRGPASVRCGVVAHPPLPICSVCTATLQHRLHATDAQMATLARVGLLTQRDATTC